MNPERERLERNGKAWKRWGTYMAERAWGTVREDYSADGDAWNYFPYEHARSRAYRWSEDGIAGICDDQQFLCFALALWNGRDPHLKERFFGLTNAEGNHGEDVKEYYFYLDNTPTHSFVRLLYKYPQVAFPYAELRDANRHAGRAAPEVELIDTGIFAEDRYFDVLIEYAKAGPEDILIRMSATNRGSETAELHLLPTLWFRNTWSWGDDHDHADKRPVLFAQSGNAENRPATADTTESVTMIAEHPVLGRYALVCDTITAEQGGTGPTLLFTENETNVALLFGAPNASPYTKDGIDAYVVHGRTDTVNPTESGTKAAAHYRIVLSPGETRSIRLRLTTTGEHGAVRLPFNDFDYLIAQRHREADTFYADLQPALLSDDERLVQRQAFAGMLWSKQFYHYSVERWHKGDPSQPRPPAGRNRNREWMHLETSEILSMPDTWEYPWFAAWDLAFHCIPLALLDPEFAKEQLVLMGREWYQHPNGQIPAYEWNFSDVNPPVLAWAAWCVYKIEARQRGAGDLVFLERVFHKLMLNFTWWVNRKDTEGNNIFQGGFLGLDNIGVFDRSAPLPTGGHIEQSDGTSWMAMFCLNMLTISLELSCRNPVYQDVATKFFEHFLYIAAAMNNIAGEGITLWDEHDQFFYDVLHLEPHQTIPLKVRSVVGLLPLFAVTTIEPALLEQLPEFRERLEWFLEHRPDLVGLVSRWYEPGMGERRLLAICRGRRMKRLLRRALDPAEFLSDYGIRGLSRVHAEHPYTFDVNGMRFSVAYLPAESDNGLFGGNSNWRGPIWFPINYLLIEALQQYHHYYGDDFTVECPTGSGKFLTLNEIADELSHRLMQIFLRDANEQRAVFGDIALFQHDPHWRDHIPFYEYFHGDNGRGVGSSHQTGWTGLVATLIQQQGEYRQ